MTAPTKPKKVYAIKHGASRFADDLSTPYVDLGHDRVFTGNGLNLQGGAIRLESYKGYILMTIGALKETGVPAWLWGEDFDGMIALLRDARQWWLRHYKLMRKVRDCADCRTDRFTTCPRHKRAIEVLKKFAAKATRSAARRAARKAT